MPLRDFDQVQERIHVRLEVRHVVQGVVAALALLGVAFATGAWWAGKQPPVPAPAATPVAEVATAGPVSPRAEVAASPTPTGAPIVPVAVDSRGVPEPSSPVAHETAEVEQPAVDRAVAEKDRAQIQARLAETAHQELADQALATAPNERAVPSTDPPEAPPASVPEAKQKSPIATPAPAPIPSPKPQPTPPVAVAKTAPSPTSAPAPAPAPLTLPARTAAPAGLTLIGTARMVPAASLAPPPPVALVSATQVAPVAPATTSLAPKDLPKKVAPRAHEDEARAAPVLGHYIIQVKAFRSEDEAKAFESELRARGHAPKLSSIEVPEKGTFYRVRLGPYDNLEAARGAQKKFEAAEGHVTILIAVP